MLRGHIALALCGALFGASAVIAQDLPVEFSKARQAFVEKQFRASAHELRLASVAFRGEVGKCKNADLGDKMLAAEAQIDQLAVEVAAGKIESVKTFDAKLTEFDLLLATNHHQLASEMWSKTRGRSLSAVGADLGLAASFYKRAMQWRKDGLTPEAQKVVDDAMRVSQALFDAGEKEPAGAGSAIEALGRALKN